MTVIGAVCCAKCGAEFRTDEQIRAHVCPERLMAALRLTIEALRISYPFMAPKEYFDKLAEADRLMRGE